MTKTESLAIDPGSSLLWEKALATHSNTLAWEIAWMEEPGGLLSVGSHRVRLDWSDLAAAAAASLLWVLGNFSFWACLHFLWGYPGGLLVKNLRINARRHRFCPWVRKIPWRRKWWPTPVFLPGKSHGQRSLASYSSWVAKSWTRPSK